MLDTSINEGSEHGSHCTHLHDDDEYEKMDENEKKAYDKKLAMKKERAEIKRKYIEDMRTKREKEESERAAAQEKIQHSKEGASNLVYPKYKYD